LSNHDKPSAPCLSSRVPYGTPITREILTRIDRAERALRDLGFRELRVRHHGDLARIEIPRDDFQRALDLADTIDAALTGAGYRYISLDLRGFRSGSLNETLTQIQIPAL
ncbi:MAG: TIGR00268 family protein, partial [Candidatus Kapaibacterium sp.]